jgi:predicted RNase H-like HicB family nuclease
MLTRALLQHDPIEFMSRQLNYTVDEEDGIFVARCIELDITTDGYSKEDAVANLCEALDCYFANPDARLDQFLPLDGETREDGAA